MFTVFDEHPNEFREKQWFMVLLSMLVQLLDSPTTMQSGWWQLAKKQSQPTEH